MNLTADLVAQLDTWVSYHDWAYASSQGARKLFEKAVNERGVEDFQQTPAGQEFQTRYNYGPIGEMNADKILKWLKDHNVPGTCKNLVWVFYQLKDAGQLDETTEPEQQPAVIVREHTEEPVVAASEPAETVESLAKIVNDRHASDAARKAAFQKMQVLARAANTRSTVKPTYVW